MIFRKRQRMIDIRELQRRGVVRIPKKNIVIPTDSSGFVELGATSRSTTPVQSTESSSSKSDFFNFMGNSSSTPSTTETFGTESEGYNKREVDTKITELDNKIYKLEQRTELLEKKLDINQSNNSSVGAMGW
ncbi:hypothetical protein KAJ38_01805 [Candidatus Pacearchaeota archaeon]|nr:hypothetical protein [Candidatus Pacearchaeota archaeon]